METREIKLNPVALVDGELCNDYCTWLNSVQSKCSFFNEKLHQIQLAEDSFYWQRAPFRRCLQCSMQEESK